ncbi:hypothetical protein WR25_18490 [Diploscapter pachys]|uniref:E3 ubiquitin-protein ligase n=1 Tax=Diploscapter pachys TaxID=2018661 RepID=A0A2A2JTW9_9BILA|nr:hypothetical protein WR25_18490 [Diploscapter pachys]
MALPSKLSDLLSGTTVEKLFSMWSPSLGYALLECHNASPDRPALSQSQSQSHLPGSRPLASIDRQLGQLVPHPIRPNLLIDLPYSYSDLINQVANFRCPSVPLDEPTSNMPTMCLVCGRVLCSQSYCCQRTVNKDLVGACRFHMTECSGTMGIFLRVRECIIIMMTSRNRGCYKTAPYVDEFGETDYGFRRGNPLHLSKEMYMKLKQLWVQQGITEEVVNQYEIDHRNVQIDWAAF